MKSRKLKEGDIVFETAGGTEGQPLGRVCYITEELLTDFGDDVMCASFCKMIRPKSEYKQFLYYFLDYIYETRIVATYQIQSTGLSNYQFEPFLNFQELLLPKDELILLFTNKVSLILKQISILGAQKEKIAQARDRLLPRLISGKLKV